MKIGEKLKKIRLEKGVGQRQLAEAAGTTAATISRYENGERLPKLMLFIRIVNALGCQIGDFLDDEDMDGKEAV